MNQRLCWLYFLILTGYNYQYCLLQHTPGGVLMLKSSFRAEIGILSLLISFQTSRLLILPRVKLRASPPKRSPSQTVFIPCVPELLQSMVRCSDQVSNSPSDVFVRVFSCGRSEPHEIRASARVQDEGAFGLGGDRSWRLRDSQLRLFGDFSGDRLLVHHRGEPRHEHERSQLPLGTVEHTRRCETRASVLLFQHSAQTCLLVS